MSINNYPELIEEDEQRLLECERTLRGSALENRVKMLRLLKTGAYPSQLQLAKALGYHPRQIRRWWKTYKEGSLDALLKLKPRSGKNERISQQALSTLKERMKKGQISSLEDARRFLEEHFGIHYKGVSGLCRLFKRHKIKLKTGRPRHRQASEKEQANFKK
jgi:transposase